MQSLPTSTPTTVVPGPTPTATTEVAEPTATATAEIATVTPTPDNGLTQVTATPTVIAQSVAEQLAYPGPFKNVPSGPDANPFAPLNPQAASAGATGSGTSTGSGASGSGAAGSGTAGSGTQSAGGTVVTSPPLANTGNQTTVLVTISAGLFAIGGALFVTSRRSREGHDGS